MTYLFTVLKKKVLGYKENVLLVLEFRLSSFKKAYDHLTIAN